MTDRTYDAVLLDIEGTTTSIAFVYDALFPYARERMRRFLSERFDAPEVQEALSRWDRSVREDADAAADHGLALMDADVKDTGLKALQGLMWRAGYRDGALAGHVYEDVPGALAAWDAAGIPVYIYSSGSVEAQRLLFGHSAAGDLTGHLHGYFDTTTGPKKEAASYRAICEAIDVAPERVVFATDNLDEARAADAAGLRAVVSVRPGNPTLPAHDFEVVTSLAAL